MPGSKPGSRRPPNVGKGRPKGSLNKATADVRGLAAVYTPEAVRLMAAVMGNKKAPLMARVMAADKLLDRAVGGQRKPTQARAELAQ
jgi:hypothetical protein